MTKLAEAFTGSWDNETAFYAVMRAGLELSSGEQETYAGLTEDQEQIEIRLNDLNYLEALILNGTALNLVQMGAYFEDDERYLITQAKFTAFLAIQSHLKATPIE